MTTAPSGVGVVTPSLCEAGQFACVSGQCVPVAALCDGRPDCADNSDELHCGELMHVYSITKWQKIKNN